MTIKEEYLNMDFIKNITNLESGISAASIAHLVLQLGSINENMELFLETLSKDCWRGGKKGDNQWLERKVNSWWKTMKGRKYEYSKEDSDKITDNTDSKIKYVFKADDGASIKNKPIVVVKEDGEWRVNSITP